MRHEYFQDLKIPGFDLGLEKSTIKISYFDPYFEI